MTKISYLIKCLCVCVPTGIHLFHIYLYGFVEIVLSPFIKRNRVQISNSPLALIAKLF